MAAVHLPTAAVERAAQRSGAGVKGAGQRALNTRGGAMGQQAGKTRHQHADESERKNKQATERHRTCKHAMQASGMLSAGEVWQWALGLRVKDVPRKCCCRQVLFGGESHS